jgi:hypothetical protein
VARASGPTNGVVSFRADDGTVDEEGWFTPPAATGTYQVVAEVEDSPGTTGACVVEVVQGPGRTIRGTVTLAGGAAGRVFVAAGPAGQPGDLAHVTSMARPGPYALHGVMLWGDVRVYAWVEPTVDAVLSPSWDAVGWVDVQVESSGLTGVDVEVPAGVESPPEPPSRVWVVTGAGVAWVGWDDWHGPGTRPALPGHRVFLGRRPSPGPTNAEWTRYVPPDHAPGAFFHGLPPDDTWYASVSAVTASGESDPRRADRPGFQARPPPDGFTVTGTVLLEAPDAGATLVVRLRGERGEHVVAVPHAGAATPWTAQGVSAGLYQVEAVLDRHGDGVLGPTDPRAMLAGYVSALHVEGDATCPPLAITSQPTRAWTASRRHVHWNAQDHRGAQVVVESNTRVPVAVSLQESSLTAVPVDLGLSLSTWVGASVQWFASMGFGSVPAPGTELGLLVTYVDDTTAPLTVELADFLDPPVIVSPDATTLTGTLVPVFRWSPPASPPLHHAYTVQLALADGPTLWWSWGMPAGTTWVVYNENGTAQQPVLDAGASYVWTVTLFDQRQSSAAVSSLFVAAP